MWYFFGMWSGSLINIEKNITPKIEVKKLIERAPKGRVRLVFLPIPTERSDGTAKRFLAQRTCKKKIFNEPRNQKIFFQYLTLCKILFAGKIKFAF